MVAITELQPWAILANGPPWMKAGLFSSVCTRFGASASFNSAAIEPAADRSFAVTAFLPRVGPIWIWPKTALQIGEIARETEDRHDFGGHRDVEAGLARIAVGRAAERSHDRTKRPVVHVDGAPPGDAPRVDVERVAPIDVIVDHSGEQIIGGADRVKIAGEMQIDVLHRHHLRVTAASRTPLHPEAGSEATAL